jgi:hypothetical protein
MIIKNRKIKNLLINFINKNNIIKEENDNKDKNKKEIIFL